MRKIALLTVARSDYGLYRPLVKKLQAYDDVQLDIIACAAHLSPAYGNTINEIYEDGITPAATVDMTLTSDTPASLTRSMGLGMIGMSTAFETIDPDILVVLGDRYEMMAAAAAAVPFRIPVAHIAGGSITLGAIDDYFRHAITKLSHIHFVETQQYCERIQRMGEADWRIHHTGSLSIDNAQMVEKLSYAELKDKFDIPFEEPPILATMHPVTTEPDEVMGQITRFLDAIHHAPHPVLITYPNADGGGMTFINEIDKFIKANPDKAYGVAHLGTKAYVNMLRCAKFMMGNSSSGIMEGATFALPVVNIGRRQEGRFAPDNVIHCDDSIDSIVAAIQKASSIEFKSGISGMVNPYGDGQAAERMAKILSSIPIDPNLIEKEPA